MFRVSRERLSLCFNTARQFLSERRTEAGRGGPDGYVSAGKYFGVPVYPTLPPSFTPVVVVTLEPCNGSDSAATNSTAAHLTSLVQKESVGFGPTCELRARLTIAVKMNRNITFVLI